MIRCRCVDHALLITLRRYESEIWANMFRMRNVTAYSWMPSAKTELSAGFVSYMFYTSPLERSGICTLWDPLGLYWCDCAKRITCPKVSVWKNRDWFWLSLTGSHTIKCTFFLSVNRNMSICSSPASPLPLFLLTDAYRKQQSSPIIRMSLDLTIRGSESQGLCLHVCFPTCGTANKHRKTPVNNDLGWNFYRRM